MLPTFSSGSLRAGHVLALDEARYRTVRLQKDPERILCSIAQTGFCSMDVMAVLMKAEQLYSVLHTLPYHSAEFCREILLSRVVR